MVHVLPFLVDKNYLPSIDHLPMTVNRSGGMPFFAAMFQAC